MKKPLLSIIVCLVATAATAQTNYHLLSNIREVWDKKAIPLPTNTTRYNIATFVKALAHTYQPNEMLQGMAAVASGRKPQQEYVDATVDMKNGYAHAVIQSEYSPEITVCYWNCTNGNRYVAMTFSGFEENSGSINGTQFYILYKGGKRLTPTAAPINKQINFRNYTTTLPRTGKNIVIRSEKTGKTATLKWNGNGFTL